MNKQLIVAFALTAMLVSGSPLFTNSSRATASAQLNRQARAGRRVGFRREPAVNEVRRLLDRGGEVPPRLRRDPRAPDGVVVEEPQAASAA